MGNDMKNIIFLFLLTPSGLLFAAEQSVILSIPSMNCPVCPITVKKSLQQVDGVKSIDIHYKDKTVAITFDDHTVDIKSLLKATENVGYPAILKDNKK